MKQRKFCKDVIFKRTSRGTGAKAKLNRIEARCRDLEAENSRLRYERGCYRRALEILEEKLDSEFCRQVLSAPPRYFPRKYGDKRDAVTTAKTSLEAG